MNHSWFVFGIVIPMTVQILWCTGLLIICHMAKGSFLDGTEEFRKLNLILNGLVCLIVATIFYLLVHLAAYTWHKYKNRNCQ